MLGCGSNADKNSNAVSSNAAATEAPAPTATAQAEETSRVFTDWTNHNVEVPVNPQRIIFHGETTGDLLALGVKPIGIIKSQTSGTVLEQQLADVEDVGFPLSVEKSLTLQPDLIIFGNADEQQYETISKVAPTVTFNTFASISERMRTLGDLLNKKQEAEDWLAAHAANTAAMWKNLNENGIAEGETASVFTMYPGNRLFIMAGAGLPQFLYEEGGFKPTKIIQDIIDQEIGFVEISAELLPEYAADRIFILNPVDPAAVQSSNDLMKSEIWLKLPAVQKGQVYNIDILKASSDATSREWLVDELPKILLNK